MLCAHHHEVNTAIVKTVPEEQKKKQLITRGKPVRYEKEQELAVTTIFYETTCYEN